MPEPDKDNRIPTLNSQTHPIKKKELSILLFFHQEERIRLIKKKELGPDNFYNLF